MCLIIDTYTDDDDDGNNNNYLCQFAVYEVRYTRLDVVCICLFAVQIYEMQKMLFANKRAAQFGQTNRNEKVYSKSEAREMENLMGFFVVGRINIHD